MSPPTTLLSAAAVAHMNPSYKASDALLCAGVEYRDFRAAEDVLLYLYGSHYYMEHGDPVMALLFAAHAAEHGRFVTRVEI